jgi:thiol-disulfide isomerase/thioredoxin
VLPLSVVVSGIQSQWGLLQFAYANGLFAARSAIRFRGGRGRRGDETHRRRDAQAARGKPAPDISGIDFRGEALNLSDYRGKVVGLVFWDSWSGPCMREVPHLRKLTERLKDKPFALLGINCNVDKQVAVKAMETERITWPNWHDGGFGSGPIVRRYHIRRYPAVIVLDDNGIVRCKQALGSKLDQAVDKLIEDLERKNARK